MDWQQPLALAIVGIATVWLVRTQLLSARRGGCGGCGGCGSVPSAGGGRRRAVTEGSSLIQVDLELPGRAGSIEGAPSETAARRSA